MVRKVRNALRHERTASTPATARLATGPKTATGPADDVTGSAGVTQVKRATRLCGGASKAREIAEAIRACGGIEAFLKLLK